MTQLTNSNSIMDLKAGLARWRLWLYLAQNDIRMRYKKTWLGIGWVAMSNALFLAAKIFIFRFFSSEPIEFFAVYLATGFVVWRLMSSIVMESSSIYFTAAGWIKSEPMPFSIYIYQLVARNLVVFSYSAIPVIFVCAYFKTFTLEFAISFIPAMIIYMLNAIWVALVLGIICTRFRDLAHLIQTAMQIMFFLTPIIWVASDVGRLATFVKWNPFTHYLAIFRDPLLYGTYPVLSWQVVIGITLVGLIIGVWTHDNFRKRVVYWL